MDTGPSDTAPAESESLLAGFSEVVFDCLGAVAPKKVVEVGAFRGEFTRELLAWAADRAVEVTAVEPDPPAELLALLGVELSPPELMDLLVGVPSPRLRSYRARWSRLCLVR